MAIELEAGRRAREDAAAAAAERAERLSGRGAELGELKRELALVQEQLRETRRRGEAAAEEW